MRAWILAALSVGGCLIATPGAWAGFVFTFTNQFSNVQPGQAQTVNVSLNFDPSFGNTTNTLNTTGLAAASFGLRLATGNTGSVSISQVAGISNPDVSGNTDFPARSATPAAFPDVIFSTAVTQTQGSTTGFPTKFVGLQLSNAVANVNTSGAGNAVNGASPTSLFLGSFRITGGTNGNVSLQAFVLNNNGDNISDGSTNFDNQTRPGTFNFTVSSVPEPTSMALVGFAATGFAGALWRKRRSRQGLAVEQEVV